MSAILSEMHAKDLLEKAHGNMNISASSASLHSKEKARAMANINENIHNKVESMIATKKQPEKVYMNHPPKK